jgi:hypothetical protein
MEFDQSEWIDRILANGPIMEVLRPTPITPKVQYKYLHGECHVLAVIMASYILGAQVMDLGKDGEGPSHTLVHLPEGGYLDVTGVSYAGNLIDRGYDWWRPTDQAGWWFIYRTTGFDKLAAAYTVAPSVMKMRKHEL